MMKKTHFICAAVLLFCVLLQGCSLIPAGQAQPAGSRMVLQVSVDSLPADEDDARIYTDSEKISAVLAYLDGMTLVQNHSSEPESSGGATRKITFLYSDGASRTYYMAGEEYLREGEEEWMQLASPPETSLAEILQQHKSDMTAE